MSIPGYTPPYNNLSLLSDVGGTARIAVNGFNVASGSRLWDITSYDAGFPAEFMNWESPSFDFDVRDGYRITSMTLTGTITGVLKVGVPPARGTPGEANNAYSMNWGFVQGGQSVSMEQHAVKDLNGDRQLQLNANLPLEGAFTMNINSEASLSALSGVSYWYDGDDAEGFVYYKSYASLNWHDAVLTVQVSPVPEPSTWGMLLAGVGLLGIAARRRFLSTGSQVAAPVGACRTL
ncbi:PEPxxWA-CTERM sorting domain-containing protein [Massilia dura]|uniref:PEPxxWA-CTERM sorting domain-containing protein n=2 Tax=Pseudoduganella dura TaxID=321982 RepID=A0A6I3X3X9_9BURK|nr:PEPxxWA-CTERM sorting domain-containing protein [Pseudoduganella dura]